MASTENLVAPAFASASDLPTDFSRANSSLYAARPKPLRAPRSVALNGYMKTSTNFCIHALLMLPRDRPIMALLCAGIITPSRISCAKNLASSSVRLCSACSVLLLATPS